MLFVATIPLNPPLPIHCRCLMGPCTGEASPGFQALTELRLGGNRLREVGMTRLIRQLHCLPALRRLDCSDNGVPEESMGLVLGALGAAMKLGDVRLDAVAMGQGHGVEGSGAKHAMLLV